jgi:hypothetical protein
MLRSTVGRLLTASAQWLPQVLSKRPLVPLHPGRHALQKEGGGNMMPPNATFLNYKFAIGFKIKNNPDM